MSLESFAESGITAVANPRHTGDGEYGDRMREIVSLERSRTAQAEIAAWPGYEPSPLRWLPGMAAHCRVGRIAYKDEAERFGLKSFKALGGSYAVAQQLMKLISERTREDVTMADLFARKYADVVSGITVATATDGNHGRSVAWGAQMFGCNCVIFIHEHVSNYREQIMAGFGADVRRVAGNYDDSMRAAASAADKHGWTIISDNSYEGYLEIPKYVTAGYSVMLGETVEQLAGEIPTHILIQGGCGGLASAVCGYFWDLWGEKRPRLYVVEPEQANCLQASARAGQLTVVEGNLDTLMAGLACGEVSPLAWEILETGADGFITLPEKYVAPMMRLLAERVGGDVAIEAGESAVAGIGVLDAIRNDNDARNALGLDADSLVLVFGTEGATDPELYEQLIAEN